MNINMRSIALIAVALIIAGITAFLARSLVTSPEVEQVVTIQQLQSEVQILVSNKNIQTGYFIKSNDLEWQSWPGDNVNINYVQKMSDNEADGQINDFLGSVTKTTIAAGEPILGGQIVKPGSQGFMAAVLQPGYRAVSINVNSRTSISGFVFPGDFVDILLTHTIVEGEGDDNISNQVTETVLKKIKVLAIDTQMSNETNTPSIGKIATFEVTPKQAEKVALMAKMGELSLALRSLAVETEDGQTDVTRTSNSAVRTATFTKEVSPVIADKSGFGSSGNKKSNVTVIRANQIQNLTFTSSSRNRR